MSFGSFDVRLDGWDVDYGAEVQADFAAPEADEAVDLDVEHPAGGWAPVTPAPCGEPRRLVFIDGVRRVEARVLAQRADTLCYGAFGSFGVGAVIADPGKIARYARAVVGRRLIYGNGQNPESAVRLSTAATPLAGTPLEYLSLSTPDPEPDGPLRALQAAMRQAEATFAREFSRTADPESHAPALVVCDGPLQEIALDARPRPPQDGQPRADAGPAAVVGMIKRVFKLYLPLTHRGVLRQLGLGQRTPVFCIGTGDGRARHAWFLRLATPTAVESDLTGLVRLEVSAACGIDAARELADETATRLPAFVPSRARDPRSPQNLLPIGALEQHLRHQLGDARLIRRKVAELIAG